MSALIAHLMISFAVFPVTQGTLLPVSGDICELISLKLHLWEFFVIDSRQ